MATRYVDPAADAGGDGTTLGLTGATAAYASATIWEAARQGNLSEIEEVQCAGTSADTSRLVVDGWTTSATNYIRITSHTSSRHVGVWSDSIYRLESAASGDFFIEIWENYTRFYAMQVSIGHGYSEVIGGDPLLVGIGGVRVERNIVRATIASDAAGIVAVHSVAGVAQNVTANNIVYGFTGTTSGTGIYARSPDATTRHLCYNNTVYNCRVGIRCRDASTQLKNNLVIGCTDAYLVVDAPESGSTNNGYDEGTDPAVAGIDLSASADGDIFVNAAAANFHLVSGSDAAGVGADLSSDSYFPITEDIDGETRSGSWSIGADHLSAAVVTGIIQNMQIG